MGGFTPGNDQPAGRPQSLIDPVSLGDVSGMVFAYHPQELFALGFRGELGGE